MMMPAFKNGISIIFFYMLISICIYTYFGKKY